MDTSDQATPTEPAPAPKQTLLQRIRTALAGAWTAAKEKHFGMPAINNENVLKALGAVCLVVFVVVAVGFLLSMPGKAPSPAPAATALVEAPAGMQDQINALRLRVIVLEARADAAQPAAKAPASAPRSKAARPAASADIPTTESPPTAPPKRWGTTDLDREIAAFPSTPSLEQSK